MNDCKCHCHNNHGLPPDSDIRCRCLPICEHCHPEAMLQFKKVVNDAIVASIDNADKRSIGDRIQFRLMSWVFPDGKLYEGKITDIVDRGGKVYYHVDAMIGSEHVEDGIVFEGEVVE